ASEPRVSYGERAPDVPRAVLDPVRRRRSTVDPLLHGVARLRGVVPLAERGRDSVRVPRARPARDRRLEAAAAARGARVRALPVHRRRRPRSRAIARSRRRRGATSAGRTVGRAPHLLPRPRRQPRPHRPVPVSWPRDDAKLDRMRTLMADHGLDALVVRAPDNVLYLTNFWPMKGYDAVVFPRQGDPTLICLEASADDAARTAWTTDVCFFAGYDASDPRPPTARTLDLARAAAADFGSVGLELSLGTQASDRMVGEPTTFTRAWFDAFPAAADAAPTLAHARSLKTEQELARLRIANEVAADAMTHVRARLEPGMRESEVAAMWQARG